MTVRITLNRICDRCFRPFDGLQLEQGDKLPEFDRTHYVLSSEHVDGKTGEVTSKTLIDYNDLCESCDGVIEKAVAKLRMDKPAVAPEPEQSSPKPVEKKATSRKELAAAVARKTEKKLSDKKADKEELCASPEPVASEPDGDLDKPSLVGDPPTPLPAGQPAEAQPPEDLPF
jgi:hypothetical protein